MMAAQLFGSVVLWIIGLLVLHFVIYSAVKSGINNSVIGQSYGHNIEIKSKKKSFLDSDLDND